MPERNLHTLRTLVLCTALAVALAGCGDDDDGGSGDTSAPPESTTTTEPSETPEAPTTSEAAPTTGADGKGSGKEEPVGPVDESSTEPWARTALPLRGMVGEILELDCPAGGSPGSVWGTNVYTDDSSVCTAAVHVGLITLDEGGAVRAEIEEGADEYNGAVSNGIESRDYGTWGGSFSFPDAEQVEVTGIAWDKSAASYGGDPGDEFTVTCRPEGEPGSVWGTDVYTDDSSICTAAVHAGLIDVTAGGEVTLRILEGQESYEGTDANGVTSNDYGSWGGSFEFVISA